MITPALDLQGTPQLIDRIALETSSADSGGDFGAAFTASLSATSATAGPSGSREAVTEVGQNPAFPGQGAGASRTAATKMTSTASIFISTAASQRAGVATAASLGSSAEGADAIEQAGEFVVSAVATKPADAVLLGGSGSQQTTSIAESQKIDLARSGALGYVPGDVQDLASVALQKLDVSAKDSGVTETAKSSQSSAKVDGSQSAAKSKVSGQATAKGASQIDFPATGAIANNIPGAALAVVTPAPSSGTVSASSTASSPERADGITAPSGAASADLSAQYAQLHPSATSANTGAPKSGALAAWNSIEAVHASAATGAAGRAHEFERTSPRAEAAGEAQSLADLSLPTGSLASGLNRSTTVPVSTAFTISGEQRVPSTTNDLSKDGAGIQSELPGVAPLKSAATYVSLSGSQPAVASSTAWLAANAHSDSAALIPSKTSGAASGLNHLEATSTRTRTASVASARAITTPGLLSTAKQAPQQSATQALSQDRAALSNAASPLGHATNASLQQNPPGTPTVAGAATAPSSQRSTVGSQAAERAKVVGSAGAASQPASNLVSQSSADRGVTGDGSGNGVSSHAGGVTAVTAAADHVAPPESFDGVAVAGAAVSTLSVQGVHQGTGNTSMASSGQGASGGQGSLNAATRAELGHPVNTLQAAIPPESHQTLVATPTSLEVGLHSGSQGWLKIRAEIGGGGEVSASLASSSPGGEQILKGQLPALNAYLHSEQMSVTASVAERTGIANGLVSHDAVGTALHAGTGSANGGDASLLPGGANQGMDGQDGRPQSDAASVVPLQPASSSDGQTRYEASSDSRMMTGAALPSTTADSGQWLNVRV